MTEKEKQEDCKESTEVVEGIEEKETETIGVLEEVNQESAEKEPAEIHTEPLGDTSIPKVELKSSMDGALSRMQSMISTQEKLNKSIERMTRSAASQNQLIETIKQIASVRERMAQAVSLSVQQFVNQVQGVFNSVGAISRRMQETLNSFDFQERLLELRALAKEAEETMLSFKTIVVELGFPPHDFMPMYSRQRVIQLYEEKGIEYTKRFLGRYMCMFVYNKETLIEMYNFWQREEWLEKRLPILSTVLEGHLNGYYRLTVPAMLAQIEGVLVEGILKLEAVAPGEQIKFRHQKSFLGQFLLGDKCSFSFDEQIEEFYLNTVLANFDRGKEIESDLSRHAILHGEDVNYGTKINSLKGILIFDYLFNKLNEAYKDIEKSKLEIKRQKEIEQSKKRTRNASGKKTKGYRKKVMAK